MFFSDHSNSLHANTQYAHSCSIMFQTTFLVRRARARACSGAFCVSIASVSSGRRVKYIANKAVTHQFLHTYQYVVARSSYTRTTYVVLRFASLRRRAPFLAPPPPPSRRAINSRVFPRENRCTAYRIPSQTMEDA